MYLNKESLLGNSKSKFVLIKDSTAASGVKLLKTVIKLFLKENVNLHFIYYESLYRNHDLNIGKDNISETDAISDPYGWNTSDESLNLRSLDVFAKLVSEFKGVVCIDSLSPLLFHNDADNVYKIFHKSLRENNDFQLVVLMHSDAHDSYENDILEKLASTVLFITQAADKLFSTIHYSSGKVTNQLVEYKISDNFEFSTLRDVNPHVKSAPLKQPDPTANLTFNLKLKDNEKEARSQLVLPYMQMQNDIENDMYDEEDPDDDLDI